MSFNKILVGMCAIVNISCYGGGNQFVGTLEQYILSVSGEGLGEDLLILMANPIMEFLGSPSELKDYTVALIDRMNSTLELEGAHKQQIFPRNGQIFISYVKSCFNKEYTPRIYIIQMQNDELKFVDLDLNALEQHEDSWRIILVNYAQTKGFVMDRGLGQWIGYNITSELATELTSAGIKAFQFIQALGGENHSCHSDSHTKNLLGILDFDKMPYFRFKLDPEKNALYPMTPYRLLNPNRTCTLIWKDSEGNGRSMCLKVEGDCNLVISGPVEDLREQWKCVIEDVEEFEDYVEREWVHGYIGGRWPIGEDFERPKVMVQSFCYFIYKDELGQYYSDITESVTLINGERTIKWREIESEIRAAIYRAKKLYRQRRGFVL